jgi:hypothetical protein
MHAMGIPDVENVSKNGIKNRSQLAGTISER